MPLKEIAINKIFSIATGNSKKRVLLTPVLGITFIIATSLFIIIPLFLEKLLGIPKLWEAPLNYILCMPFISVGLALMAWSILYDIEANGTPIPINPPSKLITTGPFAYSRNPMHGGLFLLLFGFGIYYSSLLAVLIFIPLYIFIDIIFIKKIEEPELQKRLGNDYIEYKQRTPMLLPWRLKK